MENLSSTIIAAVIFITVIIGRIIYIYRTEKYFGSEKSEIVIRIKKDFLVMVTGALLIIKAANFIFQLFVNNRRWWDFTFIGIALIIILFLAIKAKQNEEFRKKILEGRKETGWLAISYLAILLLAMIGYGIYLVNELIIN
jgi:cytochrome bd-type quinol oxidase subunit 2